MGEELEQGHRLSSEQRNIELFFDYSLDKLKFGGILYGLLYSNF